MNFDTLKLILPTGCAPLRPEYAGKVYHPGSRSGTRYGAAACVNKRELEPGVNDIEMTDSGQTIVRFSSKILGEDYPKLLNITTLPKALERLSEYLKFDNRRFLETAEVLSCHATADIELADDVWQYLLAIGCVDNPKYKKTVYKLQEVEFETVSFLKRYRGRRTTNYMTFYYKPTEMKAKRNKDEFYKTLNNFPAVLRYFERRLRVELQIRSFDGIRKAFKLPSGPIRLFDLLVSSENPLLFELEKVLEGSTHHERSRLPANMSLCKLERLHGMDAIIKRCNRDMNLIKEFIRKTSGGHPSASVINRYRVRVEELNRQDNGIQDSDAFDHLLELTEKLKAA